MTRVASPQTAPKKDVNKLETVWIDWLNRSSGGQVSDSDQYKDLVGKRGVELLEDLDLDLKRAKQLYAQVEVEMKRFELIRGIVAGPTATQVDKLKSTASLAIGKRLSIPKLNGEALDAVDNLVRRINKACTEEVAPGAGNVLKELAVLESSTEFKAADSISGGATTTSLNAIKDIFKAKPIKLTDAQQKLAALKQTCRETVRDHQTIKGEIEAAQREQTRVAAFADAKGLTPEALTALSTHINVADDFLRQAAKLVPAPPANNTPAALATSVSDYARDVRALLANSQTARDKAEAFNSQLGTLGTDPVKKKNFAELTKAQTDIEANYDAAVLAGMAPNAGRKSTCLAYKIATLTDPQLTDAKNFAAEIERAFDALYQTWDTKRTEAGKLIKFGIQLSAATEISEDEELGGVDSRSEAAKEMQENAAWCVKHYDTAIAAAKKRHYQEAINALTKAVDGEGKYKGLTALQTDAANALKDTKASPQDIENRARAFNTALGDITDKSRIRFDKDAMKLMMGAGITTDEEGDLVYSEQFRAMQAELEKGLTMWHGLCDKGVDPFKAAERAFEGIPENFWPPEAVRVIALFRKAEGEFAAEREAAELEAELKSGALGKLEKVIDFTSETILKDGSERAKDVADGMLAGFSTFLENKIGKEAFDKLSKEQIKDQATEHFKSAKIDLGKASDALGGLAAGLGAINGAYKVGKDIKDIVGKTQEINGFDPETESPVKLKMNEFERKRAIWHLVSDMADTVISALGPATEAVPALSLLGDCKQLAIDVADAYQYFSRLKEVKALKNTAKLDPETLAELALANEADKLGLLGAEKTFSAAMAIVKIIGGGLDLGGITAAAGFGVKAGATVLTYCGKGVFALIKWNDRRKAVKILLAARANPTDILYVEPVFEKCTMYSRFLLADGALNGDTWCRRYIISRGVSDTDLDNPNTSCAILREYLNVTFETMSGDAQEDDDLGTAKREKKEKAKQPSEEVDYNSAWQATTVDPTPGAFQTNYNGAIGGGLAPNKGGLKRALKVLTDFVAARDQTLTLIDEFNDAYTDFESAVTSGTDIDTAAQNAEEKLAAALDKAAETAGCVSQCSAEFVSGFVPLSVQKDAKKKPKIHAAFQTYLQELREAVALEYDPIADFRNEVSKKAMSLSLKMKSDDPNLENSVRDKFKELSETTRDAINTTNLEVERLINEQWATLKISSKIGGSGVRAKIEKKAATKLGIPETDIHNAVETRFTAVKRPIMQTAFGIGAKVTTEKMTQLEEANKERDQKKKAKAIKKIDETAKKRIQKEAVEFSIEKAKQLLASEFDAAVGEIFASKAPGTAKYVHKTPVELTREYWHAEKKILKGEKNWKFVKTGVGPAMDEYLQAKANWELLPKDDRLQGDYNGAYGSLLKKLNNIPLLREDGVELPGLKALKNELIRLLKEEKSEFDRRINDPAEEDPKQNQSDGWVVSDSKLNSWPIDQDGWVLMHDLAEKHGWEGHNSKRSLGRYFRRFGEAMQEFRDAAPGTEESAAAKVSARKYATELKNELSSWDPNKKMLRTKPEHKGIMKYKTVMITRLTGILSGELA
ncbi:MAG: hypothetical protein SFU86_02660 [Pirellulaceae bacterium]|nr:hypothetical protein [Pirellulaceae bacterium]